ncbi:hypothetical protein AX14_008853 [Amanita brunnescens Koide BX004]|nr:hypothetical protein AX14_008853 [Amanita brunnescens Koide BX004]
MEPGTDFTPGTPHVSPIKLTAREQSFYPDLAYAISTLSRYLAEPSKTHLIAIQRAIRNLKQT